MWWSWAIVVAALAGCLDAQSSRCSSSGTVCPVGTVCIDGLDQCVTPPQVQACAGRTDGTSCATSLILVGTCNHGACLSGGECGNGVVETGEACDDGNRVSGDGCSADCKSNETCGNGIVDPGQGEQCDCGMPNHPACAAANSDMSGPCSTTCRLRCGDGIVESDERCDPALSAEVACAGEVFDRGLTGCSASCQPIQDRAACRYIGWRTRPPATALSRPIIAVAPTGKGTGYYLAVDATGTTLGPYMDDAAQAAVFHPSVSAAAIWASVADDYVFAVGEQGWIATGRYNSQWTYQQIGFVDLRDVWGRASNDVYAVGDGTVLHSTDLGSTWPSMAAPAFSYRAVAGDDMNNVYVVGDAGALAVWNGSTWQTISVTSADLYAVWAVPQLAVAVGAGGTILQNDGTGWAVVQAPTTADLRSVWGSADDGFFAAGDNGTMLFYDGHVWRTTVLGRGVTGPASSSIASVRGVPDAAHLAAPEVLAVAGGEMLSYEGAAWAPAIVPTIDTIYGLWASASDDVYAVGGHGTILHHDGTAWTQETSNTLVDLHAVWGNAWNDVYAAGVDLTLLHFDGLAWSSLNTGATGDLSAVVGTSLRVYVAGSSDVFTYNGALVSVGSSPLASEVALAWTSTTGLVAGGPTGIWQLGVDSTWMQIQNGPVAAMTTTGSDIFAIGAGSYMFDGMRMSWTPAAFTEPGLTCIAAGSNTNVFVAGTSGKLRHWDGTAIEPLLARTTGDLEAVLVVGNLVVMAGADGELEMLVFHH